MPTIEIEFTFRSTGKDDVVECMDFDAESGIDYEIDGYALDRCFTLDKEFDADYSCESVKVVDYDEDYADPADFNSLEDYGEYVEKCEEHGEAYRLRYEDTGDFDFDDEYNGCWDSEEDFVQNLLEDLGEINVPTYVEIDWDGTTRNVMMDYSSYDGREGTYIFRD